PEHERHPTFKLQRRRPELRHFSSSGGEYVVFPSQDVQSGSSSSLSGSSGSGSNSGSIIQDAISRNFFSRNPPRFNGSPKRGQSSRFRYRTIKLPPLTE